MLQIAYRKKGIRISQYWFTQDIAVQGEKKADISFFHGILKPSLKRNCYTSLFHTLITNLQVTEEKLQAQINKNVRYEIRRNMKEAVEYRVFDAKELKRRKEVVDSFANMYELMYLEKGKKVSFNRVQFEQYVLADAIMLTAVFEENTPLVFHSYLVDESQVRLLHSVSDFRSGQVDSNLIARANKRLHWEDLCLFKDMGKESYDWGGVSSLENPNGIDSFKFKFGGEPFTYYNVYRGDSLSGKMAIRFLKWKNGQKDE